MVGEKEINLEIIEKIYADAGGMKVHSANFNSSQIILKWSLKKASHRRMRSAKIVILIKIAWRLSIHFRTSGQLDFNHRAGTVDGFSSQLNRKAENQLNTSVVLKRSGNIQSLSRLDASSSVQRAIQTGPSSMIERSLSCSAKVLLSRYNNMSRNSNSNIPR